jgi:hypothetical protein
MTKAVGHRSRQIQQEPSHATGQHSTRNRLARHSVVCRRPCPIHAAGGDISQARLININGTFRPAGGQSAGVHEVSLAVYTDETARDDESIVRRFGTLGPRPPRPCHALVRGRADAGTETRREAMR